MNPFISVFLIFLTSLFTQLNSVAQVNLVPNPSFEIHDSCPDNISQIHRASGWRGLLVTPDYHHFCATTWRSSIPRNLGGYQYTYSTNDSAYGGIVSSLLRDSVREIIGITLTQQLIIGRKYYISFLISAGSSPNEASCYSNRFGIKLITYLSSLTASNKNLVDNFSHFYTDSILSDTTNWIFIKGSFTADSAYTDLLLGNFYTVDSLDTFCAYSSMHPKTYYYVDQICLSEDSAMCELAIEVPMIFNPQTISVLISRNEIRINVNQTKNTEMDIYDSAGRLIISELLNPGVNLISKAQLASGLYLIRIENQTYKFIH